MMTLDEARSLIEYEALEGIAVSSRHGEYPDRARVEEILEALRTLHRELRGQETLDRKLAACLFILNDQVQGNMAGAQAQGIPVPEEFSGTGFFEINQALYAIFEDWEEQGRV